jgi:large subunit ribosomal protein L15
MVINKRKKNSRQRGSHTHGCGSMKKRRGKGNKGGAGMAGTGKRGDAKKPMIWKDPKYFGKYGFKKKNIRENIIPINLSYFEEKLDKLVAKKLVEKQGDTYIIDVKKLGFNKVLSQGKLKNKYKITSPRFSKEAAEKIKAAGGEAIQSKEEATPAEKKKPKPMAEESAAEEKPAEEEKPEESKK